MKSADSIVKKYKWIFLGCIIALGAVLRLYALHSIPPGVNRDEASIGYTAYSLLKTGADEYGRRLPLSFESFGDWKLPLYIYATVPFVKILGPTELAIRLVSAMAGISTIVITFFLVLALFRSYKLSFIASLLLAISPWHIHFSRVESESNVAVMFTSLGLLLFLKGLKKYWLLPLAAIFLSLPYYTYHGNHVTSSLLLAGLMVIYWKKIPKHKISILSAIILFLLPGFILFQTLGSADKTKISGIGIFGDPSVIHNKIEIPRNKMGNSLLSRLVYNRITYAVVTISDNYLKSLGPEFLFIRGGTNHAHNIQNFGNLYLIELPFFYLGILYLIKKRKSHSLLLWWLFISPVAAAITKDAPHSNRMFAIFPLLPILTAIGFFWLYDNIKNKKVFSVLVALAFAVNVSIYLNRYFIQFPKNEAQYWGYGYQQLAQVLSQPEFQSKKIIMSHPEYSPYVYFLLYTRFDPLTYQQTTVRYRPTEDSFVHVKSFNRFEFREIQWDVDSKIPDVLLVEYTQFLPERVKHGNFQRTEIVLPNRQSYLTIIKT